MTQWRTITKFPQKEQFKARDFYFLYGKVGNFARAGHLTAMWARFFVTAPLVTTVATVSGRYLID